MDTLDFEQLSKDINPNKKRLSYNENKQFFTKVAFDVFQLNNSPVESYWVLETAEDGKEYLVAKYEDDDANNPNIEARGSWNALSDKENKNVTLFYKGVPIRRFASSDFGFDASDIHIFQNTLTNKLASDITLVSKLMNALPKEKRQALIEQFPEFK